MVSVSLRAPAVSRQVPWPANFIGAEQSGVLLLQLSQPSGLLGLHPPVLLAPAVVGGLRHLQDPSDVGDGLALGDRLLGGFELADDLLRSVTEGLSFTLDRVPGSTSLTSHGNRAVSDSLVEASTTSEAPH